MNPFVNPRKRGVQLPKGFKDLNQPQCEYCPAPAVGLLIMGLVVYRWCAECQRDLREFAAEQEYKFDSDMSDETAVSRYRDEMESKEEDFMDQKVKGRKQK